MRIRSRRLNYRSEPLDRREAEPDSDAGDVEPHGSGCSASRDTEGDRQNTRDEAAEFLSTVAEEHDGQEAGGGAEVRAAEREEVCGSGF